MAQVYYETLHEEMKGLTGADKVSLIALRELLGDTLIGEDQPFVKSSKAELVMSIEKIIKNVNKEMRSVATDRNKFQTELGLTKAKLEDVSAEIGYR